MALLSWDVNLLTSVFMLYCSQWLTPLSFPQLGRPGKEVASPGKSSSQRAGLLVRNEGA